ncbi:DUF3192 domain-containing protein [Paraferrimonas sedimenticola]|uniref:DUF3192 domain-containing protein n=1 Tax=Paraferrimonas sedimenticola TaxID=375674 RepID=A0AA37RXF2_9GAMM|nr:DUF3192 domain-containing protein [Paraferrimonas sedimenticola]GLP96734.1 hypothetical protein GCM10007895_20400 [Paraferrimonas sedimenticola]
MSKWVMLAPAALLVATLSGCSVHVGSDKYREHNSDWEKTQLENRKNLNGLTIGMDKDQVQNVMGFSDLNEAFQKDGKLVQLWYYRTQHVKSDGRTTKDECTPLVLVDGSLIGWGESAVQSL